MEEEDFDSILSLSTSSYSTPSHSRYSRSSATTSSSRPLSWMTEQRRKRGYGRRAATVSDFSRLGMELGDDTDADNGDNSMSTTTETATTQVVHNNTNNNTNKAQLTRKSSSGTKRYPRRRSFRSPSPLNHHSSLDEEADVEVVKVAKKKRPNGRPPLFVKSDMNTAVNHQSAGSQSTAINGSSAGNSVNIGVAISNDATSNSTANNTNNTAKTSKHKAPTVQTPTTTKPSPPIHHRIQSQSDFSTPAANTRRRVLQRSRSAAHAAASRALEENRHPNDHDGGGKYYPNNYVDEHCRKKQQQGLVQRHHHHQGNTTTTTTTTTTTRKNKKRTATTDTTTEDVIKASPPKIANRKSSSSTSTRKSTFSYGSSSSVSSKSCSRSSFSISSSSSSSTTKSSFGSSSKCFGLTTRNGSFGSLAKSGESHWGGSSLSKLSPEDKEEYSVFGFSSPPDDRKGVLHTPLVGKGMDRSHSPFISDGAVKKKMMTPAVCLIDSSSDDVSMKTTPAVCLSPPSSSCLFSPEPMRSLGKDANSDDESMSSCNHDDNDDDNDSTTTTSSSCSLEQVVPTPPTKPLSDQEILSNSTHEDFQFLLKSLSSWSKSLHGKGKIASMGLRNGCQIAIPIHWTSKRKSAFLKWAYDSFGLKSGRAGMNLVILRCVEARGLEILGRLKRISKECQRGSSVMDGCDAEETMVEKSPPVASAPMLDDRARSKPSVSHLHPPSAFPFCDENDDDVLAESFDKNVNIDKTKKANKPRISLQPNALARAMIKSPLSMMSRRLRQSTDSHASQLTIDSGRKTPYLPPVPPRFSTESAMSGTDFLSQIHGAGPLSPRADLGSKLRQRASRMLHPKRSSLEKPRLSFESCARGGKPYESPHPNHHCIVQNTPLPRADFGCECPWETPMPKQAAEHWGSQPIVGRDWGSSCHCDSVTIKSCTRIFAQAWFKSDFNGNDAMCDSYKMSFLDEEQASLQECYNSDSEIENEEDYDKFDMSPEAPPLRKLKLRREDSVGGSALALLHLDDADEPQPVRKPASRRSLELRKYRRRSLCATAYDFVHPKRCLRHSNSPLKQGTTLPDISLMNDIVRGGAILTNILSFFDQTELLQCASLVCTAWNDAAAEALGTLMIQSVGCDPLFMSPENDDDYDEVDTPRYGEASEQTESMFKSSSIARSMEKDWSYFENFSTGRFLSEGAFKKVFKVWNRHNGSYEALSVMDVDAITETGNLHTVGAELAVSALLSSIARRNIAPNFVITRGVFTCQNNLPPSDWDDAGYEGGVSQIAAELKQGDSGNFQFIRMELCKHADTEDYIRKLPTKMLTPLDCRNVLFQMAFALHVAGDKLGMKHYDVKLLNFFLQSALDESTSECLHPHVVLRYGVGSSVFRLRMDPSNALIVKLADYGTSVLRSESDGQPVSIGQFTTFENTPPDYLILGNDARQGYGHDCFGLGLSMLHLFTGHCPYEEILRNVVCPDALKTKLRKIWKSPTHDIICSAMMYEDSNGEEVEDETFYDTLYRFIVLFGMPEHKIKHERNSKVRRAINSTLLKDDTPDSRVFESDRCSFSLAYGTNEIISNARERLKEMDGAMDLLLSLVCFDPAKRSTPLDVITSRFMAGLVEDNDSIHDDSDIVRSYMSYYSTK